MKRFLCILVTVTLLMSLMAGCGADNAAKVDQKAQATDNKAADTKAADTKATSAPAAKLSGKVTFATNRTDWVDTKFKDWTAKFSAKNPGVAVEVEGLKDYAKIIKTRLAAGQAPDVFLLMPGDFKKADYPKYFAPIDDLQLGDIYLKDFCSFEGKQYAIPVGLYLTGVIYNKAVFKKIGYDKFPTKLDDLYAACDKLKAAGITPTTVLPKEPWPAQRWTDYSAPLFGPDNLYDAMMKTDTPLTADSSIGKACKFIFDMKSKGYMEKDPMSTSWDSFQKDFAAGKIAFGKFEQWLIPSLVSNGMKPEDVGNAPLPADNSGKLITVSMPDWSAVVNKDSKNLEAVKAWYKYMFTDMYAEMENAAGCVPAIKSASNVVNLPQIQEFNSYNATVVDQQFASDDAVATMQKAQWEMWRLGADVGVTDDINKVFNAYNKKWADARKK